MEINCNADCDITASITLEDGGTFEEDLDALPDLDSAHPTIASRLSADGLPHPLHVTADERTAEATLINAPAHIEVPAAVAEHHRWGLDDPDVLRALLTSPGAWAITAT